MTRRLIYFIAVLAMAAAGAFSVPSALADSDNPNSNAGGEDRGHERACDNPGKAGEPHEGSDEARNKNCVDDDSESATNNEQPPPPKKRVRAWLRDLDGDGQKNGEDACVLEPDQGHIDSDGDGFGDACDPVNDGCFRRLDRPALERRSECAKGSAEHSLEAEADTVQDHADATASTASTKAARAHAEAHRTTETTAELAEATLEEALDD